jgi:glycosyltransferase involved in cell wall biosynthesis
LRAVPLFRSFIPSKMFEILACGRPILASLEGEAAEILRASGAAVVVPPEDVDALVDALVRLAAEPSLRTELAERGRPYVAEHFGRRQLAARYLEVLAGAARPDPSQAPRPHLPSRAG